VKFDGAINSAEACVRILKGAVALYGMDKVQEAQNLVNLIASADLFNNALKALIRVHFGNPDWEPTNF
jgi:hypothetical protein